MYKGRRLVIATMHQKEVVITPILEKELGVECFVPDNFDTDMLGTFTGETPRVLSQIETVRQKCLLAMKQTNCDLGVASEGSFGSHPTLFFVPADDEFLIFIDKKNDIEIVARKLSTETNFSGQQINSEEELLEFSKKIKFPSHRIILKLQESNQGLVYKDFLNWNELKSTYHSINKNGVVMAETDMRAMNNPTRMSVISIATEELLKKIVSLCPICNHPGFSITESKTGLPCESCQFPTNSTLAFISQCQKCNHTSEELYPHGKKQEEPMYCNFCNP